MYSRNFEPQITLQYFILSFLIYIHKKITFITHTPVVTGSTDVPGTQYYVPNLPAGWGRIGAEYRVILVYFPNTQEFRFIYMGNFASQTPVITGSAAVLHFKLTQYVLHINKLRFKEKKKGVYENV
jgi:hypothetical protein